VGQSTFPHDHYAFCHECPTASLESGDGVVRCSSELLAQQGESALALETFRQGREIVARLKEKSPDSARPSKELAWFDGEIARLRKATAPRR
jgi:hypothetical protein